MEIWKDIPGYEGKYQASSEGRIRSVDHRVRVVARGTEATRLVKGRVLRPGRYCKSGHLSVVLGHGTAGKPVHQLVARTFLGDPPEGSEVCHNDGNPQNNAVDNLRYDTRRENILDVYRQGGVRQKLSIEDVQTIRKLLNNGMLGKDIATKMRVSENAISRIKRGRAFTWLE